MQQLTAFSAPHAEDYDNVRVLNTAFLAATTTLRGRQRERLAATPFFLFSLREQDAAWWRTALQEQRQHDLIADHQSTNSDLIRIQIAALGFIWQLAQRNAHTARLVCGAPFGWCEQIVALPLLTLLDRVGERSDLIESRLHGLGRAGERLAGSGASSRRALRRAAHLTALQALLTDPRVSTPNNLSAAACEFTAPVQVRDKKL